jgi:UV DNA damage endonuclease
MPINLGYCCINTSLQKQGIVTSRGMIKRTFDDKGIVYASQLALANTTDLIEVLEWNARHNIKVFRMGSDLFPWASQYKLTDLPDITAIAHNLVKAGLIAFQSNQRLSFHPDHFVKLASEKPEVVANSVKELELHSAIMDLMGLPTTSYNPINIHVGMNFSKETAKRWIDGASMLSRNTRARLVVENDDKNTGFSVQQLYDNIHKAIDIPITFDYFHHEFHPDGLTTEQAAKLAASTWDTCTPLFHYSESKLVNENVDCNPRAHSDFVYSLIPDFGLTLDIDLEAKAKEEALLLYRFHHERL